MRSLDSACRISLLVQDEMCAVELVLSWRFRRIARGHVADDPADEQLIRLGFFDQEECGESDDLHLARTSFTILSVAVPALRGEMSAAVLAKATDVRGVSAPSSADDLDDREDQNAIPVSSVLRIADSFPRVRIATPPVLERVLYGGELGVEGQGIEGVPRLQAA